MPTAQTAAEPIRRPKTALRILVAVTVVAMIVMNVLANALPFFGRGTGEVSALYPTLVTPAGYVFAIWGLISNSKTELGRWIPSAQRRAIRRGLRALGNADRAA